jgi:hypothetical protein
MTSAAGSRPPASSIAASPPLPRLHSSSQTNGSLGGSPSLPESGIRSASDAAQPRAAGSGLLTVASCLLLLLAAAQGYVSFRAQYVFVDHAKHAHLPSLMEALGLDTGAVIFALLALSLARRGGRADVERALNVICALGSMTMNLLAANLTSPRSVTVWVLPSTLYALASDRLIAVVRRWVLSSDPRIDRSQDRSAWHTAGGLALWILRLILDLPGTTTGFRRWVLAAAPVAPGILAGEAPKQGQPALTVGPLAESVTASDVSLPAHDVQPVAETEAQPPADQHDVDPRGQPELGLGETKREALIRLYEYSGAAGDPRYGNRAKAAQLAREIAGRIGYHPGTARRELVRYLASQSEQVSSSQPDSERDTEAVA